MTQILSARRRVRNIVSAGMMLFIGLNAVYAYADNDIDRFAGVSEWEGSFELRKTSSGAEDVREASGTVRLSGFTRRPSGGGLEWTGSADAREQVAIRFQDAQALHTVDGQGASKGKARLRIKPGRGARSGRYELKLKLGEIPVTAITKFKGKTITREKAMGFTPGSIHLHGDVQASGLVLTGKNEYTWRGARATYTSILKPVDDVLEARPVGKSVERGMTLTLDGSASRGRISRYHWTIKPGADCIDIPELPNNKPNNYRNPVAPTVEQDGKIVALKVLCSVEATLDVSDGQRSDSMTITIAIKPRTDMATTFRHDEKNEWYDDSYDPERPVRAGCEADCLYGINVCAVDKNKKHTIHRKSSSVDQNADANAKWRDDVYWIKQISDKNSPFDGWWYVSKVKLIIHRKSLIHVALKEESTFYNRNVGAGKPYAANIRRFSKMIEEHEKLHSTIVKEALDRKDENKKDLNNPAKYLEAIIGPREEVVELAADVVLHVAEQRLREAGLDHNEINRRLGAMGLGGDGYILFPVTHDLLGEYQPYRVDFALSVD